MNEYDNNEIIEINDNEEVETLDDEIKVVKEPKKKNKKSLKDKWDDLDKKKKTLIIVGIVVVILLIAFLLVYFLVLKKPNEDEKPQDPVIVEKDNYRYENGNLIFLDNSNQELGSYECENKDTEKCLVAKLDYSKDTFDRILNVNESGIEIEKSSQIYLDNYVFVKDGDKIILYDINQREVADLELLSIKTYGTTDNLIVIEDTLHKYGLIKITESGYEYLIRPSYDNLSIVNAELQYLAALDKEDHYIIDNTGKRLSKNFKIDIKNANSKYIVGVVNNKYNLYDYNYNELESGYDYIGLHNGVISFVSKSRVYLKDEELQDLNKDGVRITSTDYIKKYVYDKDNRLVDTKVSYEIDVIDNNALVKVGKDTTNINLMEGKVSATIPYMSYYEGKLYFYGDSDKTDLLGTYTCNNKNNLTSSDVILNNCNIYHEEELTSGIYNNRYVFIYDNATENDLKYYLYDLKEKKVKGTYSTLAIVNEDELQTEISHISASPSYVIARSAIGNNSGKFGILEIGSTVKGKIEFKYKEIISNGSYYVLVDDDSYVVYNNKFSKVSNEFAYIKLYDNYYVGINNNKLNVFSYTSSKEILEDSIRVVDNEFEISFENGFTITIDDDVYRFDKDGERIYGE